MKALFFSPFSGIWEHSIPEFYIANYLKRKGHEIYYIKCGKAFHSYCHTVEGRGGTLNGDKALKEQICKKCNELGNKQLTLLQCDSDLIDAASSENVPKYFISEALADPKSFYFENIPFGKHVLYDTILRFKKQSTNLESEDEKTYFTYLLDNAFKAYQSIKRILPNIEIDIAIIYSPQYSTNHVVAQYLENSGIPVYFLEAGTNIPKRLKTMRCWKWSSNLLVNPLLKSWETSLTYNFSQQDIEWTGKHYQSLLKGKSHMVYSRKRVENWDFHRFFPKANGQKVILATMSSFDEAYSAFIAGLFPKEKANSDVFPDQVEWIKQLINFIETRSELYLIVRVHPRDFPNRREGMVSDQGKRLLKVFDRLPENVEINWPKDSISIYDLYINSDVITTGWSITALEAGMLGLPVVTYDSNLPSYPISTMFTGRDSKTYFENILRAVEKGWSFEQAEHCFRWLSLNHNHGAVTISNYFDNFEANRKALPLKIHDRLLSKFNIDGNVDRMLKNTDFNEKGLEKIEKILTSNLDNLIEVIEPGEEVNQVKKYVIDELTSIYHLLFGSQKIDATSPSLMRNLKRFLDEEKKDFVFNRH